ncbi:MAG: N-acetylmuramoyl-L-alanine amidase [Firmicutes bacterium]|nr:N-acetylmuramoyl-L-alanine amidase [Bacillota bacterium]
MARGCPISAPLLLGCILVLLQSWPGAAQVRLFVEGRPVRHEQALILLGSGLGIALDVVVRELGVEVEDAGGAAMWLRSGERSARVQVGTRAAVLDGRPADLPAAPEARDGTVYVPLNLVADLTRMRVNWNALAGVLALESRADGAPEPATDADRSPARGFLRPVPPENRPTPDPAPPAGRPDIAEPGRDHRPAALFDVRLGIVEGRIRLEAITDRPVEPVVMYMPDPDRLVIDLPATVLATGWQVMPGDGTVVRQVRVSTGLEGEVRIVADLTGPTGYRLLPVDGHPGFAVALNHQLQLAGLEPGEGGILHWRARVTGGPVEYRAFLLRDPLRLVVDLLDVTLDAPSESELESETVSKVRVSQFQQDVVRVVFDLRHPVDWPPGGVAGRAYPRPDGVLDFILDPARGLVASAGRQAGGNLVRFVGFVRENGSELILLETAEPIPPAAPEVRRLREPDRIVLDLPGVALESTLGPLVPPDSAVVTAVRAGQASPDVGRVVVETNRPAELEVVVSQDRTRAVIGIGPSRLAGRTIVVDPGHGGRDPGAIGPGGTQEKDINLAIALRVARFLEQAGARVVVTRDRDVYVELAARSRMANAIGADAFVSIHADAVGSGRTASGTATFYHPGPDDSLEASVNRRYAESIQRELLRAIGLPDRGVRQRAYHVVLHTEMPSALVEVAFIDNPAEEQLLTDPDFQTRAARGIAQGILRFFAEQRPEMPPRERAGPLAGAGNVTAAFLEKGERPAGALAVLPVPVVGSAAAGAVPAQEAPGF